MAFLQSAMPPSLVVLGVYTTLVHGNLLTGSAFSVMVTDMHCVRFGAFNLSILIRTQYSKISNSLLEGTLSVLKNQASTWWLTSSTKRIQILGQAAQGAKVRVVSPLLTPAKTLMVQALKQPEMSRLRM
uniref:Uncharacterized protein n=1 Tax=Opuntia streptacantha TaxID=393608 RepID=A0A7C9ANV6_OPUST